MTLMKSVGGKLQALGIYILCASMIQTQIAFLAQAESQAQAPLPIEETFKPFGDAKTIPQAQITVKAAEQRPALDEHGTPTILGPDAEADFEALVRANQILQVVGSADEFIKWWQDHEADELKLIPDMGKDVSWQYFLTNVYAKYMAVRTHADTDPSDYIVWLHSLVSNPYIAAVSHGTTTVAGFILAYIWQVLTLGLGINMMNNYLNSGVKPALDKATSTGNRHLGKFGKWLYTVLNRPKKTEQIMKNLDAAKSDFEQIRAVVSGSGFNLTPDKWAEIAAHLQKTYLQLNLAWNDLGDGLRAGRDNNNNTTIGRPMAFGNGVASALTAAEVHLQGAEQTLDRVIARGGNAAEVDRLGQKLMQEIGDQIKNTDAQDWVVNHNVLNLQAQLEAQGASADQVRRVSEGFRRHFIFMRQAATFLAEEIHMNAAYHDLLVHVNNTFQSVREGMGLNYFRAMFASEVKKQLDSMSLSIDLDEKLVRALKDKSPAANVIDLIKPTVDSQEGQRAIGEPDSTTRDPKDETPAERVKDVVRAAGRK